MLIHRWKLCLGVALALPILAGALVSLLPPEYRTRALVATTRVKTRVSLGTSIETLSEDDLASQIDPKRRLTTFVKMVPNPLIAQQVLDEIGHLLPQDTRSAAVLIEMVEATIAKDSDAIAIDITHRDPQVAALLANTWAGAYVGHVNRTYSGDGGEALQTVRAELEITRTAYEQAQMALANLMHDEQFDTLNRRLAETQALLQSISDARAQAGHMTLGRLDHLSRLLASAQDLRDQVAEGGDAAAQSSATAFALLKADAFGALTDQTASARPMAASGLLQHPLDPTSGQRAPTVEGPTDYRRLADAQVVIDAPAYQLSSAEMLTDLDALIAVLQARQATLMGALTDLVQNAGNDQMWRTAALLPSARAIDLEDEDLAQLATAQSHLEQLARELRIKLLTDSERLDQAESDVALARETLRTLERKEAELALSALTTGAEVRLAVPATIPMRPILSPLKVSLIAAVVGLVLGVMAAYGQAFWHGYRERIRSAPDSQAP